MVKHVLMVEDDRDISRLVQVVLEREGFKVQIEREGELALARIKNAPPALVLLDLGLPNYSGLELCKQIRFDPALNRMPIIMVTARVKVSDRVLGLEVGADDYISKPFDPQELVARVKALLRRTEAAHSLETPVEIGSLSLDPASYRVVRDGKPVRMSTLEFKLLYYLASHPDRVFSRDELLDAVWGKDRFVTPRSVDFYIRLLREKVERKPAQPIYIKTQRGAGYMFDSSSQP